MTNQQKGFLLVGLLAFWVILFFAQFSDESPQTRIPVGSVSPTSQMAPSQSNSFELTKVHESARHTVAFSNPRNIFAPLTFKNPAPPPQKEKPKSVVAKPHKLAPPKPAPPPGPSPEELAAQRARQLLNKYRFLGYLKKGGENQAFLSNGKDIYIVRQGEIMEGRIHVNRIDPTAIVLSTQVKETGDQIEATIPLTKEKKG